MSDTAGPATGPGHKGEVRIVEADRLEHQVARRSAESRATVPMLDLTAVVDAGSLLEREAQAGCGIAALVVVAVAKALRAIPRANATYKDGHFELYSRVNIGITLMEAELYITPTVFDADQKTVGEISQVLASFDERAREGELHPSELTGATFKLVDASAYDIVSLTPIIHAPHAAALGFGPVRDVPVIRNGRVVYGHALTLGLSVDNRIMYGYHAASFLEAVKAALEEGAS